MAYLGKKHTLDLQRTLPYDAIYETPDVLERFDLFDAAPSFESKRQLVRDLSRVLSAIPVRKISGDMSYLIKTVLGR